MMCKMIERAQAPRGVCRYLKALSTVGFMLWISLVTLPAYALDRLIDHVDLGARNVVIHFSCPMLYLSHFPAHTGDDLRIEFEPLPGCAVSSGFSESVPFTNGSGVTLRGLRLEPTVGAKRALLVDFGRQSDYVVRPLSGLMGVEVVLSLRSGGVEVQTATAARPASRPASRLLPPQLELDQLEKNALSLMYAKDYDGAIRLYTKLLEYPEHPGRARAQEYLGLARERKGQFAQAKQEYQEYLSRYSEGPDAPEVAQRLAALVTLNKATKPRSGELDKVWQSQASVSQEFRHDQNTVTQAGVTGVGVGQSVLYNDADFAVRRRGQRFDLAARVSAGYLADFQKTNFSTSSAARISSAYTEVTDTDYHVLGRLGRQSDFTGGGYGLFDGAYLGWRISPLAKLNLSVGSPLQIYSPTLSSGLQFASTGLSLTGVAPGLNLDFFVREQRIEGYLDQREFGAQGNYYRNGQSLVAQLNYDVSYRVLNAATLIGSLNLPDRWVGTFALDRRKAPFVSTYNALIGQQALSLSALISQYGEKQVRSLALDHAAQSDSFNIGLQRPLGTRLQWWSSLAFSHLGSTPASLGVPAVPSIGGMFTGSTQILSNGLWFDSDTEIIGAGYGSGAGTRNLSFFVSSRFAVTDHLRLGPRLTIDDTKTNASAQTGVINGLSVNPSVLLEWQLKRGSLQLETGYEQTNQTLLDAGLAGQTGTPGTTLPGSMTGGASSVASSARRYWVSAGYHVSF